MRKSVLILILFFTILISFSAFSEDYITLERKNNPIYKDDPLCVKAIDPAYSFFPDSSLVDFSFLLSPPAGKFGFVKRSNDGHFFFENNKERVKFWGVVISQEHVDIPKERIKEVVEQLARSGMNMLRLHAFDNRGGEQYGLVRRTIIEDGFPYNNDSQHLNKDVLDRLDFWVAECKKRGIYVYLVLRGYRTFKDGDGVESADKLDRAARPYAMFNQRLIDLQKEYGKTFLIDHINPYTNLSFANDPAIAAIEIFNEDSIFMRPEKWQDMAEPYMSEFHNLWNEWLKKKYSDTTHLKQAWTNEDGVCALADDEILEKGNIRLPNMDSFGSYTNNLNADYKDALKSPVRRHDAALFGIDIQTKYLTAMKDYLQKNGVKVPTTGVVYSQIIPDSWTVSKDLDFTAENAYYAHPAFLPGKEWASKSFTENINYIKRADNYSFMPFTTRYKWSDTPLGIREWATCWPNEFRASSILETAAYARFQDFDLMTFFQYNVTGDLTKIGSFNITCDPARWLMFPLASKIFLKSDLMSGRERVKIGYSKSDMSAWANFTQGHHYISWISRCENTFVYDENFKSDNHSLFIASGRTHNSNLGNIERAIIYSNCSFIDFTKKESADEDNSIVSRCGYQVNLLPPKEGVFVFNGLGLGRSIEKKINAGSVYMKSEVLSRGYEPFGVLDDVCLGFYDAKRKNLVFAYLPDEETPRFGAQLMKFWDNTPSDYFSFEIKNDSWLISDTNQLKRNPSLGIETIDSPQIQAIQGDFIPDKEYSLSTMKIKTLNDFGVIAAISLDDKPLSESKRYIVKLVTKAFNRLEKLEKVDHPDKKDYYMTVESGAPPIQTGEKASDKPTVIELGGRKIIESYMTGGWWEILFDEGKNEIYLASSARNMKFKIEPRWTAQGRVPEFEETRYYYETPPDAPKEIKGEIIYPSFQKYIRLKVK